MPSYRISDEAQEDLVRIWHYTARNWTIAQADRLAHQFHGRFQFLAENPFIGIARPEFSPELRSFIVLNTPFIIFYYPTDFGIEIVHIRHGSQDFINLFAQ